MGVRGVSGQAAIFSPPGEASQQSYVWIVSEEPYTVSRREVTSRDTRHRPASEAVSSADREGSERTRSVFAAAAGVGSE